MPFGHRALLVPLLLAAACASPPPDVPPLPDWENPEVFERHRERPHATCVPFADRASALRGDADASPYYRSLNGTWRFHWSPTPEARPRRFFETDFDGSGWHDLPVASRSMTAC